MKHAIKTFAKALIRQFAARLALQALSDFIRQLFSWLI